MSSEAASRAVLGPNSYGRMRREARQRRAVVTAIVVVLLLSSFVLVTGQTGFPGPGAMRRYRTSELQALADRLDHLDCSVTDPAEAPGASVDWLRSRVHLEHPERVLVAAGDRSMIENPGPAPTGMVPTWSVPFCPSHTLAG